MRTDLEKVLPRVSKPFRYIGGEWGETVKDHQQVDLTFALAFPDLYEIGMSHLGFRILYALLNNRKDCAAERVFCPWPDMAAELRQQRIPLTTLETGTPLNDLDVVGFSLQYEMTFTNILEMLDLAGIPLRTEERGGRGPLIVAGGPAAFNPEPLADFIDLIFVGDGEELLPEFIERLKELKRAGASRADVILDCSGIEGIYAPSRYKVERDDRSGLLIPVPEEGAPFPVKRRVALDLDRHPFPDRIIVPHGEIVHDRVSIEIMRGCPVGCRFCQAGYTYRPTRQRDPNQVRESAISSIRATGYDQFSLSSLNSGEYGAIQPVMIDLMERFERERVSLSLSSLHASTITPELTEHLRKVRKSGFTIAPEAGTQRLRNVINKNLNDEQILTACRLAFEAGWHQIKLYFMIGLPTETDADIDGIVDLAHEILEIGRQSAGGRRRPEITLSASSFVPKPATPFQWAAMDREQELRRKQERIAGGLRRGIRFKHHRRDTSLLEGIFTRGDRALCGVIEQAWRMGARFDGWDEQHNAAAWEEAFRSQGVDTSLYAHRRLDPECRLPWDVIDPLINRRWLAGEYERALKGERSLPCGPEDCHGCAPFAGDCVDGAVARSAERGLTPAPPRAGALQERDKQRYRTRFTKLGPLRFLGHLDLTRLVLRAFRRAGIALVYSQGFNPKPKVSFGPALPVGLSSRAEYADFESYDRLEPEEALERINRVLPAGVRFEALGAIRQNLPALCDAARGARYLVQAAGYTDLEASLADFESRSEKQVSRQKKNGKLLYFDLSTELLDLERLDDESFRMSLALRSGGASVRPGEVLQAIFGERSSDLLTTREELLVDWNGRMVNPMLAASAGPANHE
jgi:radical SAM family uncharacterized protein/radical SAM-linked protein